MESLQVQNLREMPESQPAEFPDWEKISDEITCPLCDYNLRGLTEPRCPECGHQFNWEAVLDRSANIHPWLFEHQSRRNIWSFFQTAKRSLRPRIFWQSILPIHQPILWRLVAFSLLSYLPIVFAIGIDLLRAIPEIHAYQKSIAADNARYAAAAQASAARLPAQVIRRYGSLQAYIAATSRPIPTTLEQLQRHSEQTLWYLFSPATQTLAWPFVTLLSLLIFRTSLRQARIKTSHLIRCIVYSEVPFILMLTVLVLSRGQMDLSYFQWHVSPLLLVGFGFTMFSLGMAYHFYLRFPHALWTVLASQIIFILVDIDVRLNLATLWY